MKTSCFPNHAADDLSVSRTLIATAAHETAHVPPGRHDRCHVKGELWRLGPALLILLAGWMAPQLVTASQPVLLKDINTLADVTGPSPAALCTAGSTVFFVGNDPLHGQELWKSDGTPAGTAMVKDIAPGEGSSGITALTAVGDAVYFTANDGVHGSE